MAEERWVYLKSDLALRPKHREAMGEAIWLYLYMLDLADWETGMVNGWKDQESADAMAMPLKTLRTHRRRLEDAGYISSIRGQYGQSIVIHNWKNPRHTSNEKIHSAEAPKRKAQSAPNRPLSASSRVPKNGHSAPSQSAQIRPPIYHVDLNTSIHDHDNTLSHEAESAATPPEGNSQVKKNRSAPPDALYAALERVCRMPVRQLRTDAQKFQLDQTWNLLRKAGVPPEEVDIVGEFYYTVKLAGKAGNPIRPHEVREYHQAALIWKRGHVNENTDTRWREHYERELKEWLAEMERDDTRRSVVEEVLAQLPRISTIREFAPLADRLREVEIDLT